MAKNTKPPTARTKQVVLIVLLGIIILLMGVWSWYRFIFYDAENTFWATVDANLKTYGVTRQTERDINGFKETKYTQIQINREALIRKTTIVKGQEDDNSASKVTSQEIFANDKLYSRYTEIEAQNQGMEQIDFSAVINQWAVEDVPVSNTDLILGFAGPGYSLPFAYLSDTESDEVVEYIKKNNVYTINFRNVKKIGGSYEYPVSVNQRAYVGLLQKLDKLMGINQLQQIDTTQYASQPDVDIKILINVKSRQVQNVTYPNGETEILSGYGARVINELPNTELSREELERQLQQIITQ